MIYGIGYIDPSKRYAPVEGWYEKCILFHSKKYHKILETTVIPQDTICIDAETGVTETHKRIISNYFKGSRMFINIGAAGAVTGRPYTPAIGDVVQASVVLPTAGLARLITNEFPLKNEGDPLPKIPQVTVQCLPTLYYDKRFLVADATCVEQESEAVAATCMWLNKNYGEKYGKCFYANIFYISDTVHRDNRPWKDTLKMYEHTRDIYRKKVLDIALSS